MQPSFNDNDLVGFEARLQKTGRAFTPTLMGKALRVALKPVLAIAQREVPTGPTPSYQSSLVVRGRNKGYTRLTSGYYARGGATRQSLRIAIVSGEGDEITRGLVGVSKRKGERGWRTHLITRVNKHRSVANDFLDRTERQGVPIVVNSLQSNTEAVIERELIRG